MSSLLNNNEGVVYHRLKLPNDSVRRRVVISPVSQDPFHLGVLQVATLAATHHPDCSSQPRWMVPVRHNGQKHTLAP